MEYQVDISCAQNINSTKYLIKADQTAARIGIPNKANKIALFNNLNACNFFVDIVGVRHPRNAVSVEIASSDYLNQYRDLEFLYKENAGEKLLSPFKKYADMKNINPVQLIDLRFQVVCITKNCMKNMEVLRKMPDSLRYYSNIEKLK